MVLHELKTTLREYDLLKLFKMEVGYRFSADLAEGEFAAYARGDQPDRLVRKANVWDASFK